MAALRFTGKWIEPIRAGVKTQTLRRQLPATVIMADRFHALNGYRKGSPPFAELEVISVDRVHRSELTEADARREGVGSLAELRDTLEALYPGAGPLMRVRFRTV
jgi:uncharacterized protein YqfB (UPF0267 family)